MIRNLKVLGLALVAVFAMSALTASAASAQTNGKLTIAEGTSATLDATETGTNALFDGEAFVECPGTVLTGHKYNVTPKEPVPAGAETVTLSPDYVQSACFSEEKPKAGVHKVTVFQNNCDYVLHLKETIETNKYSTTVDIVCPESTGIVVNIYFASNNENIKACDISVPSQNNLEGAVVTTDTANDDLKVTGRITGITLTTTGLCGHAHVNTGEFELNATVKGTGGGGENVGITVTH